jgi:hypothetical protein
MEEEQITALFEDAREETRESELHLKPKKKVVEESALA